MNNKLDNTQIIRNKSKNLPVGVHSDLLEKHFAVDDGDFLAFSFESIEKTGVATNLFPSRIGGVSEGEFSTMNFSFSRGDNPKHVTENYRRAAHAMGGKLENFVLTYQTHTCNVRVVTDSDRGKGVISERDYRDVDGLVTNCPGIILTIFGADCVPVFFVDPVNKAIGACHAGWRGTKSRIAVRTLEKMTENFGTSIKDVICAIGPSICQDCYEVSEELDDIFTEAFPGHEKELLLPKGNGKYQLDLWSANVIQLMESGVPTDHISVTDVCTHCNPDILFSHRAQGEKRGNNAGFLMLK